VKWENGQDGQIVDAPEEKHVYLMIVRKRVWRNAEGPLQNKAQMEETTLAIGIMMKKIAPRNVKWYIKIFFPL
jgi:hypothetical protein